MHVIINDEFKLKLEFLHFQIAKRSTIPVPVLYFSSLVQFGSRKIIFGSVSDQPGSGKMSPLPRRADTRHWNSGRTGKERRCAWPSPTVAAVFLSDVPTPPPPDLPVPGKPPPAETPDVPRAASAEHSPLPSSCSWWQPFLQCFGSALVSIRTRVQFYLNADLGPRS